MITKNNIKKVTVRIQKKQLKKWMNLLESNSISDDEYFVLDDVEQIKKETKKEKLNKRLKEMDDRSDRFWNKILDKKGVQS